MPEDTVKQQQPESDETLAARAAQGDQAAFVALYDRHFGEVYDVVLRLLLLRAPGHTITPLDEQCTHRPRSPGGGHVPASRLQAGVCWPGASSEAGAS